MTYRAWNTKTVDRAALKELTAAIAQQNTEELENQSMDDGPWSEEKYRSVFAAQQKEAGLLAGILAARGITDPAEALTLLAGEEELSDPMLLTDMDKACARILRAIDEGETIVVFGDYDVDGVTATALLYQHLKGMGASAKCMLPSREGDGYGLSKNAIQSIYDKGCRLIVTVDNGISAVEEAAFAASLGIDLIITDHHLPHESLPQAVAIVDPRRADDHSPFKGLCGAGVAFKLCAALDGCPPEEMLDYCGDLAAVGTVADVMPLTGENRTIVKAGLRQLQNTDRPGFCALLEEVGLAGRPVTAENVSYAIAPRINAAGRMDSAVTALQLVLCEDEDRAEELAHKLTDINSQRQKTEMEIVRAAQELLDAEPERLEDRVILLWGRDWHPGVIGIVASRLVEKTGRPVIVVSVDEHGEGKGSGRSVQGFNLHECIASCADILLRFGGHAMAAGLSVREEDLPTLRQRLNDWAARACPVLRTPPLECDLSVHLDRLTVESVRRLDQLAPYGADNPSPVFVLEKAVVEGVYAVSEGKHSRLRLRQGNASLYAVWFGMHPEQVPYSTGDVVDAAISLSVYDSPRGAQLSGRILELHPAGFGNAAAQQPALVQALRRGSPLTAQQRALIAPERSDIITVYRELQARRWHAEDMQPLFAKLGEEHSGKTLVAAAAIWFAAQNGWQSAMLAPTEILARQHAANLADRLEPFGVNVTLLVGGMKAAEKRVALAAIADGRAGLVVGTHAVLTDSVVFKNLGLAIVDEQHRFGVRQRGILAGKANNPHLLVMSATPIPRTLGLLMYGDLDISILDELPPGRKPIKTWFITGKKRRDMYGFLEKQIAAGHQVYIVCPAIEENEMDYGMKAVKQYYEQVACPLLPGRRIGLLHGNMKPKDKDDVMQQFKAGELDVLVSTTMIEVGVDVPNATVMVIENAERFGLSALHQLRGRVGRGAANSCCILI